jgi:hypothetical protein
MTGTTTTEDDEKMRKRNRRRGTTTARRQGDDLEEGKMKMAQETLSTSLGPYVSIFFFVSLHFSFLLTKLNYWQQG